MLALRSLCYALVAYLGFFAHQQETSKPAVFLPHQTAQMISNWVQAEHSDSLLPEILTQKIDLFQKRNPCEKIYVATDRSLYEPGDTVWFAAFLRNTALLPSETSHVLYVELLNAQSQVLQRKMLLCLNGTGAGEFGLAPSLPGGQYTIKAFTAWSQNEPFAYERSISLQKTVAPRLNMRLEFERKAYGIGDEVSARFDALNLENKAVSNQKLRFVAQIDGSTLLEGVVNTDAAGRAIVRFTLPKTLQSSDALLNILLEYGGQTEAISRAIPVVLNAIDLQFFPEGGLALVGTPTKMAFKAINEFGKAADVSGRILDDKGLEVAQFSSFHQGMGTFDFIPKAGIQYHAALDKPIKTEAIYPLPNAEESGMSLQVLEKNKVGVSLLVQSKDYTNGLLLVFQNDSLVFSKKINSEQEKIVVPTQHLKIGLLRMTVFARSPTLGTMPMSERLVFVNQNKALNLSIRTDKEKYLPREMVKMEIVAKDAEGKPVEGRFALAVGDDTQLTFADDKQGHLLAQLLLEQDLKGKIEEPNFYFDQKEKKAEQALDNLLLTQGWRRFDWEKIRTNSATTVQYASERADYGGILYSTKKDQVIANRSLSLEPNGPSTRTDNQGRFRFEGVDLSLYTHIKGLKSGLRSIQPIYSRNILLYEPEGVLGKVMVVAEEEAPQSIICGRVMDSEVDYEGLFGATVKIIHKKDIVGGGVTDLDGYYSISISPGVYDLEISYTGYKTQRTEQLVVHPNRKTILSGALMTTDGVMLEAVVTSYKVPLIQRDQTSGGQTLTSDQIRNLPTRSVNPLVENKPIAGKNINIQGSRSNATNYYVDGIRVTASSIQVQDWKIKTLSNPNPIDKGFDLEKEYKEEVGLFSLQDREAPVYPISAWRNTKNPAEQIRYGQGALRYNFDNARTFYAPKYGQSSNKQGHARSDFRSTIYWNPAVKTDKNGLASLSFYTSDAITNFRASIEGMGKEGQIGRKEQRFFTQKPLSLTVKTPPYVIEGDTLALQVVFSNKTDYTLRGQITYTAPKHFSLLNQIPAEISISAQGFIQQTFRFAVGATPAVQHAAETLSFSFKVPDAYEDGISTEINTLQRGFPTRKVQSSSKQQNAFDFYLNEPIDGTTTLAFHVFPNPLDDVMKGLDRLLRQPNGCFEQVSSSNYPNILALNLLRSTGRSAPNVEQKAEVFLAAGYQKLAAYECKGGGFDWWGKGTGHEGLTAYGIIQFYDMQQVFNGVEIGLYQRSIAWLLSRRDGKGGWRTNQDQHGWQSANVLSAYLAWTLSEVGLGNEISKETDAAYQQAISDKDPYTMALLANALLIKKDKRGKQLLQELYSKQGANGAWTGASHSIMQGSGQSLSVETTALVVLAMLKNGEERYKMQKAMDFLFSSKTDYGFGSTQATVLALKAILAVAAQNESNLEEGQVLVLVDGKRVFEQAVSSRQVNPILVENLLKKTSNPKGKLHVEVFFEYMTSGIPFDVELQYASRLPNSSKNAPFSFTTSLKTPSGEKDGTQSVSVGETVQMAVQMVNLTNTPLAAPMLIVGMPAGLSPQVWELKKMVEENRCDFYEIWGDAVVFHFKNIDANASHNLLLNLKADVAGSFEAPASRAFLYYEPEQSLWAKPNRVEVKL